MHDTGGLDGFHLSCICCVKIQSVVADIRVQIRVRQAHSYMLGILMYSHDRMILLVVSDQSVYFVPRETTEKSWLACDRCA
ncbi:hypothetical protein RB213_016173, partial [Colletotrichum asianum]